MQRKKHTPEEIVAKFRQVDVLVSQGRPVAESVRQFQRGRGDQELLTDELAALIRDHSLIGYRKIAALVRSMPGIRSTGRRR